MINRVNSLNKYNYSIYKSMFPKEKIPLYENINSTSNNSISMNIDANKAQIQELAKIVSQAKVKENKESIIDKNHTQKVLLKRNHYIPIASFWGIEDW